MARDTQSTCLEGRDTVGQRGRTEDGRAVLKGHESSGGNRRTRGIRDDRDRERELLTVNGGGQRSRETVDCRRGWDDGGGGPGSDFSDEIVANRGDIKVPRGIHRDPHGSIQRRRAGGSTVAACGRAPSPGDRADDAVGRHLANGVVVVISDEKITGRVDGDVLRVIKTGGGCEPAVAVAVVIAVLARNGADDSHRVDLSDNLVIGIRDEEIPLRVKRQSDRMVELSV